MESMNFLMDNDRSFTQPEKNTLIGVFSKILLPFENQKNKSVENLELLDYTIKMLNKFYFSNLDINKKEKSFLIQLIDKFQAQKEMIELASSVGNSMEDIEIRSERFAKKMQSSVRKQSDVAIKNSVQTAAAVDANITVSSITLKQNTNQSIFTIQIALKGNIGKVHHAKVVITPSEALELPDSPCIYTCTISRLAAIRKRREDIKFLKNKKVTFLSSNKDVILINTAYKVYISFFDEQRNLVYKLNKEIIAEEGLTEEFAMLS